jgi:hypothetical protein
MLRPLALTTTADPVFHVIAVLPLLLFHHTSQADSVFATSDEALPFRRLLASTRISDRDLEDRSAAVANALLQSAYKRFEVSLRACQLVIVVRITANQQKWNCSRINA